MTDERYTGQERRVGALSRDEAETLAESAANKAVRTAFRLLGMDIDDQRSLNEFRADLIHAHKMRRTWERGGVIALSVIVGAAVAGAASILWQAVRGQ